MVDFITNSGLSFGPQVFALDFLIDDTYCNMASNFIIPQLPSLIFQPLQTLLSPSWTVQLPSFREYGSLSRFRIKNNFFPLTINFLHVVSSIKSLPVEFTIFFSIFWITTSPPLSSPLLCTLRSLFYLTTYLTPPLSPSPYPFFRPSPFLPHHYLPVPLPFIPQDTITILLPSYVPFVPYSLEPLTLHTPSPSHLSPDALFSFSPFPS